LATAEAKAAPILAKIHEYEQAISALQHELHDKTYRDAGGVMRSVPKYDLTPEERAAKEKELAEKTALLAEWENRLDLPASYSSIAAMNRGKTTADIERLREQIATTEREAEEHRRRIAELESDEPQIRGKAEEKRKEAAKLIQQADEMEAAHLAAIERERSELKRLMGSEVLIG
jgi:chromosome segregation ATPase